VSLCNVKHVWRCESAHMAYYTCFHASG
jgi:hypothetical protein